MCMYGLGLGVIGFGKVPWMEEQMKLRKIVYGQRRPFYPSLFTLRMYTSGIDLDSGLG